MTTIKFGTDGWRAIMDKEYTFENVEKVSQATADYLLNKFKDENVKRAPKVVIGYDWRRNSENFAAAVADVLSANGIETLLSSSACPTPAVSYKLVKDGYDLGVAVTASHNPPDYNGIKIKSEIGASADKHTTDAIETYIGKNPVRKGSAGKLSVQKADFREEYLNFVKSYVNIDIIRQSPYKILVDSMHGVGARNIEDLLRGGKIQVTTLRGDRDVTFGGTAPEPIAKYLGPSIERMQKENFDLCIVTDGDADRVGALRPGGDFVSPGTILSLILIHFVEDMKRSGSVVTTISNTALIYRVARKFGLKVHETPVGFKYVVEIMKRERVLIGGEESGGIAFQDYLFERDGMLSGLLILEMMAMRKKSFVEILNDVEKEFGKLYYVRSDLNYPNELKPKLFERLKAAPPAEFAGEKIKKVNPSDGMKFVLEDDSWLLFRLSGTEPILRIYSEASSQSLAENLVKSGRELAFSV